MKIPDFTVTWDHRPCYVNGKKAFWHMWTNDEKLYLKFDSFLNQKRLNEIYYNFKESNVCGSEAHIEKISRLVGVVEYEDGTISLEDPQKIRFIDSSKKFNEICWDEEHTCSTCKYYGNIPGNFKCATCGGYVTDEYPGWESKED